MATEVKGSTKDSVGRPHWQEAVAVHNLESGVQLRSGRLLHLRNEERWVVVAHNDASFFRERCQKTAPVPPGRLDIWEVHCVLAPKVPRVRTHSVEDELMSPVARPSVADAKGFENDQRLLEFGRVCRCLLKGEVPARPSKPNHPVNHVRAFRPHGRFGKGANADGGSGIQEP